MAGIGFALRSLSRQESLSALVKASGHAAVIAAGPWLFTVVSLAAITAMTETIAGHGPLASCRAVIIYAFATSLVSTAPVCIVATRLLADHLWRRDTSNVPSLLIATLIFALAAVALPVLAIVAYFHVPGPLAISLYAAASIVSLIWVALAFCGAVRDYRAITYAFLTGLLVAVAGATAAAFKGLGAAGMVWGFSTGLALTFTGLALRVLTTFPGAVTALKPALMEVAGGHRTYAYLALGAFLGTAGIWIDKWVFWFSSEGQSVEGGLIHAPLYDSAMFIASLVIIPALAQFVVKLETEFFERYQAYFGAVQGHGTIDQIEEKRRRLEGFSFESLTLIAVAQLRWALCWHSPRPPSSRPSTCSSAKLPSCGSGHWGPCSSLSSSRRRRSWCFSTGGASIARCRPLFFVLNGTLAVVSAAWGEEYYGAGYFLAAFCSAAVALVVADRTLARLNYLTFIGNNPSVIGVRSKSRWRWPSRTKVET